MSLSSKVLSFARDKNDFFCTHELGAFYNGDDFGKLSAIVGRLKQMGKLTMTDVQEPCKMQSKKHHFYIYNKRQNEEKPKIDEDGDDNFKTEISKNRKEIFDKIKESVLKQTGEFCRHTIAKETNISAKVVAPYLKKLREKKKLKYTGKKDCSEGLRIHKFYIVVNKNLKNVKVGSNAKAGSHKNEKSKYTRWEGRIPEIKKMMENGKTDREIGKFYGCTGKAIENLRQRYGLHRTSRTIKNKWISRIPEMAKLMNEGKTDAEMAGIFGSTIRRIEKIRQEHGLLRKSRTGEPKPAIEADSGVLIKCLSCGTKYLEEHSNIVNNGFATCPNCGHRVKLGA